MPQHDLVISTRCVIKELHCITFERVHGIFYFILVVYLISCKLDLVVFLTCFIPGARFSANASDFFVCFTMQMFTVNIVT